MGELPGHVGNGLRAAALVALLFAIGAAIADETSYPGFRLVPPGGDGWRQVQRNAASMVWMRRLDHPAGSFSAAVLTGPAPAR